MNKLIDRPSVLSFYRLLARQAYVHVSYFKKNRHSSEVFPYQSEILCIMFCYSIASADFKSVVSTEMEWLQADKNKRRNS